MIRIDDEFEVKQMTSSGKKGRINSWNLSQYSTNPPEFQYKLLTSDSENYLIETDFDF